jgi:diguanylate cyclase (GGDEF)-like protein
MEEKFENNIFFISDNVEKYEDHIMSECRGFNFIITTIKKSSSCLKDIKRNIKREQNLIIIDKNLYNSEGREEIKNVFSKKIGLFNPHFLLLSRGEGISLEEQRKLFEEQNFFYQLSELEMKSANLSLNHFFIKLVFQRMKDLSRLNDYIINSFQTIVDSNVISQQKGKIEKLYKELESLSKIDVLTSVLNRRALFEALETEKSRTMRDLWRLNTIANADDKDKPTLEKLQKEYKKIIEEEPQGSFFDHYGRFSCLMIDIDDFKLINDKFGHLAGDQVLKKLGEMMRSHIIFRENDIIGRYGGEEFVVILPETNVEFAKIPADRFREKINSFNFMSEERQFNITVSIGISEFRVEDKSTDELINRADKALYYAKSKGKNMTVIYDEVFDD